MPMGFADSHNDLLLGIQLQRDLGHPDPFGQYWLARLREAGFRLIVLSLYTEDWFVGEGALRRNLRMVESARQLAERHAEDVALVTSATGLREARATGRIALLLGFEGMEPIGADVELIDTFWQLGVRMGALTWNRRTPFADGLGERGTGAGLTELGRRALERMERLGMIVDVSHLSDAGFDDIARLATRPFVASHSSCRDVHDHPRNLDDQRLRRLAAAGGYVGMNTIADFVGGTRDVDAFIDHVSHAVALIGPEHVGLGLDLLADTRELTLPAASAAPHGPLSGLARPEDLPALGARLVDRLGAEVAAQVCGGTIMARLESLLPA